MKDNQNSHSYIRIPRIIHLIRHDPFLIVQYLRQNRIYIPSDGYRWDRATTHNAIAFSIGEERSSL